MVTASRDWAVTWAVIELWPSRDWAVTSPSRDWAVIIGPRPCDHRGHRELTVTIYFLMGDLELVVSRSRFEISLFEEWEGWLTWNERDVSLSFMTMTVTYG